MKNKVLLILTLLLGFGFFLRIYNFQELFLYSHDQGLAGWFIKGVLVDRHLRLIGQETSTHGIFIGPFFYYLLIPFYIIFGMDPKGGVFLVALLGLLTIFSLYFVFSKVFNQKVGLVASVLYTFSFYTIFNDREVVPTMPVILWTVWFLYALSLIFKGRLKKAFILLGVLLGLIWHLNAALVLVLPLVLITIFLSKRKIEYRSIFIGFTSLFLTTLPLIVFEIRHGFSQSRALIISLTTNQSDIVSGYEKFARTLYLVGKNIRGFLWGDMVNIPNELLLIASVILAYYLYSKKVITRNWVIVIFSWILIYVTFFSLYSKVISEYYLNGLLVVWIIVFATFTTHLLSKNKLRNIGYVLVLLFVGANLYRFFTIPINKSGYKYKKAIVEEIKVNAESYGYPCVAVSYITDPGLNMGYRYFFWRKGLHVNRPDSGSPVYTIVYPLKDIFPVDKTFGALGLIYPEYTIYDPDSVKNSCSGEDSNLTDPLFGYTE